jgi:hypothetical protein
MRKYLLNSILTYVILIISSVGVNAQILDHSQNPTRLKFYQINAKNFQIIYPEGLDGEAQKVANTLEAVIADVSKTLKKIPHPISIILQNQGVVSNGFVTMAPRRVEFYTIPGQEFDTQDWVNSLCVHELRHVVQFDKIAGYLGKPLFEELKLALFGINLPSWYFEGDAVGIETILTPSGLGRQPDFDMVFRANVLSNKKFSYSKNYLGSVKNNTPGYYPLGYFMVTKMRRDFGPDILDKVLNRIAKFPLRPFNFSNSFKKYSGYNTQQLHQKTISEMDSLWNQQSQEIKPENYQSINNLNLKNPSNYLFPFLIDSGNLLCLKDSKSSTTAITLLSPLGKEKKLLRIGYQTEPNMNYANGLIVWDEFRTDERFQQRSYNVINSYDIQTKRFKQLTYKTRLFSPSLSVDGKLIIAVKASTQNKFSLVEIDSYTGKELKTYPNPKNLTLQFPCFDSLTKFIVVTAVGEKGKTLLLYNRSDKSFEQILPYSRQLIAHPTFYKDNIIYKAHYNGIDNLYSVNLHTKQIKQLTNAKFGAFNAAINLKHNRFLFNDYQWNGYNIASLKLDSLFAKADTSIQNHTLEYFKPLLAQENTINVLADVGNQKFEAVPYKEFEHLLYFHSITPIVKKLNYFDTSTLGFDILSNNKLGTLALSAGYQFQQSLQMSEYHFNASYSKFYPIISFGYQNRPKLAYARKGKIEIVPFTWRENFTEITVNIPYATNWLNQNLSMNFETGTNYTQRYDVSLPITNFNYTIKFPLSYQYSIGLNQNISPRDLAPRFGQNMTINYNHLPFQIQKGELLSLRTQFYFPGLMTNHSLQVSYNMQSASGAYDYNIDIPRASGYANIDAIGKIDNTLLIDYRFPIAYPDWELGPLAYIKRFKGGFFTDFENLGNGNGLRTCGLELRADMNLLRYYLPNFDVGGKLIFPVNNRSKTPIFEFGFNYNL